MRFKKCSSVALFGFVSLLLLGLANPVRSRSLQASSSDDAIQDDAWPRSGFAGRLLLNQGNAAVSEQERTQDTEPGRLAEGAALSSASSTTGARKARSDQSLEEELDTSEADPELPDEDTGSASNSVLQGSASSRNGQHAAAPTQGGGEIDTLADAPAPVSLPEEDGVKRYVPVAAAPVTATEKGDDENLESEVPKERNHTQSNRALNDTREEGSAARKEQNRTSSPEPKSSVKNTTAGAATKTEDGDPSEADAWDEDDEGGLTSSRDDPPQLKHRTSSWEGFGDPSKQLTLVVVCSNTGGGVLEVKIVTPTWIRADPESVRIGAGEERNVTLTVLDPKGLKGQSERIEIQSNGGDEFFEITKAALGRTEWYDGLPSTGSNTGLIAGGVTIVGLAALTFWVCRRRKQRPGSSNFKYKELEMQGDLSSALGQLPAGAGMAMSYSSGYGSGRSARAEEDSGRGWDDNWDDWDEEDQRSRR